jgi:Tripartite tricarboxylate transporter TctB family
VLIIAVLIAGAIAYSIRQILREKRQDPTAVPESAPEPQITLISSPVYRPLFALFFVALFVYVLRETYFEIRPMEERAALFPIVLGIPCLALAFLAFGQELFNTLHREAGKADPPEVTSSLEPAIVRRRAVSIVAWILGFLLAIWLLGFVAAVPVASFLYFRFAGGEKWSTSILLSLAAGAIFYGLFDYLLHLPFPEGTILAWLNLSG